MRRLIKALLRGGAAAVFLLSCAQTVAVPKAAEHAGAEVSFGEAQVHPKPAAKPGKTAKPASSKASTPKTTKSKTTGKQATKKKSSAKSKGAPRK